MFVQAERPMRLTTPLGPDVLVLVGFEGHEAISQLFRYQLDLVSTENCVPFEKLLGQEVSVEWEIREGEKRHFSGIVSRFSQGERSFTLTRHGMEVVPRVWLLTRKVRSRIFQHTTVPDILKQVLKGLEVSYKLTGEYKPRDYCAQYRESDFDFISRLMEEEGIFYFFEQSASGHTMVVADTPQAHPDLGEAIYEEVIGGMREEDRVWRWEKIQELRSGKYTLWDHCFELPGKHLEAEKPVIEEAALGRTVHPLKVGGNDKLEIYEYPGGYAQRFDGVDKSGGDRASDIQNIFKDNQRTVDIRMQAETTPALTVEGESNCGRFSAGYKFGISRHFSDGGKFVLTVVNHHAHQPLASDDGQSAPFEYTNRFVAIPYAIPFRPPRVTPVPTVRGSQTATVVGPPGEEIFTDKYGRVKVQFHWDREGRNDADSACWIRVATPWAGKRWGAIHIPRIGQEVVVDFLEGHPDRPIIVGSVYNADQMPPYALPDWKTKSGIRSHTTMNGGRGNCNEVRFEDKAGAEQLFLRAERDMDTWVQNDSRECIGRDRHEIVGRDMKRQVKRHRHSIVAENEKEKVGGDAHLAVGGDQKIEITGVRHIKAREQREEFDSDYSLKSGANYEAKTGSKYAVDAGQEIHLKGGMKVVIEGGTQVTLKGAGGFVDIGPAGVTIQGNIVNINSGGAAGSGSGASPASPSAPSEPEEPDTADDGTIDVD